MPAMDVLEAGPKLVTLHDSCSEEEDTEEGIALRHVYYSFILVITGCFTQTATKEIDTVSDLNEPAEKQKKI